MFLYAQYSILNMYLFCFSLHASTLTTHTCAHAESVCIYLELFLNKHKEEDMHLILSFSNGGIEENYRQG